MTLGDRSPSELFTRLLQHINNPDCNDHWEPRRHKRPRFKRRRQVGGRSKTGDQPGELGFVHGPLQQATSRRGNHSRRPWSPVHVMGVHQQRRQIRPQTQPRHCRRLLRQRHDRVVLGQNADRAIGSEKWFTIVELSTEMVDYIDTFHNHKRRDSSLDVLAPTEYETQHAPMLQLT